MSSLQEALTEALEHPISEAPRRKAGQRKPPSKSPQQAEGSQFFWWGVLASVATWLLVARVFRRGA